MTDAPKPAAPAGEEYLKTDTVRASQWRKMGRLNELLSPLTDARPPAPTAGMAGEEMSRLEVAAKERRRAIEVEANRTRHQVDYDTRVSDLLSDATVPSVCLTDLETVIAAARSEPPAAGVVESIAQALTYSNFISAKARGDGHAWTERLAARVRALATPAAPPSASGAGEATPNPYWFIESPSEGWLVSARDTDNRVPKWTHDHTKAWRFQSKATAVSIIERNYRLKSCFVSEHAVVATQASGGGE